MTTEQLDYNPILGTSQAKSDEWAAFLGRFSWFWFCTFTFRDTVHPERADKLFHVLMCMMNRRLYGRRWSQVLALGLKVQGGTPARQPLGSRRYRLPL